MNRLDLISTSLLAMKQMLVSERKEYSDMIFNMTVQSYVGTQPKEFWTFFLSNFFKKNGGNYVLRKQGWATYQKLAHENWESFDPYIRRCLARGSQIKNLAVHMKKTKAELERELGIYSVLAKKAKPYDNETHRVLEWASTLHQLRQRHHEAILCARRTIIHELKQKIKRLQTKLAPYRTYMKDVELKIAIISQIHGEKLVKKDLEQYPEFNPYEGYTTVAGNMLLAREINLKKLRREILLHFSCPVLPHIDDHKKSLKFGGYLFVGYQPLGDGQIKLKLASNTRHIYVDTGCPYPSCGMFACSVKKAINPQEPNSETSCTFEVRSIETTKQELVEALTKILELVEELPKRAGRVCAKLTVDVKGEMVKVTADVSNGRWIHARKIKSLIEYVA